MHHCVGVRRYRYSLDSTLLTEDQRQFYEDNGFLVIRGLVGESHLKDYYDRFQQICSKDVNVRTMGIHVVMDTYFQTECATNLFEPYPPLLYAVLMSLINQLN